MRCRLVELCASSRPLIALQKLFIELLIDGDIGKITSSTNKKACFDQKHNIQHDFFFLEPTIWINTETYVFNAGVDNPYDQYKVADCLSETAGLNIEV